jgi:hypothetical protein
MRERSSEFEETDVPRGEPMRDQEICRMAAFRIRETANRIATLANNASDGALKRELLTLCQRLLAEERTLLQLSVPSPRH